MRRNELPKILGGFLVMGTMLLSLSASPIHAETQPPLTQEKRFQVMEQEMQCINKYFKKLDTSLPWQDVCYKKEEAEANKEYNYIGKGNLIDRENIIEKETNYVSRAYDPYEHDQDSEALEGYNAVKNEVNKAKKGLKNLFGRDDPLTTIDFGGEFYLFEYEEPGIMKDDGKFYGIFGTWTKRTHENKHLRSVKDIFSDRSKVNMYRIDSRIAWGTVDYDGGISVVDSSLNEISIPIQFEDVKDWSVEARGLIGYDLPLKKFRLTPYMGLGYRYLNDDTSDKSETVRVEVDSVFYNITAVGYQRESNYLYLPVGIELHKEVNEQWSLTVTAEYDVFLWGKQISHLEDLGLAITSAEGGDYVYDPIKNKQNKGYGVRGSVRLTKKSKKCDFFIEPFYRYWHIEDSEFTQATSNNGSIAWFYDPAFTQPLLYYEPENKTNEYGVKAGLFF